MRLDPLRPIRSVIPASFERATLAQHPHSGNVKQLSYVQREEKRRLHLLLSLLLSSRYLSIPIIQTHASIAQSIF
jgi:hypothetical protein